MTDREKIKEALEFYANKENYKSRFVTEECGCCTYEHDPVMDDGEKARTALAILASQAATKPAGGQDIQPLADVSLSIIEDVLKEVVRIGDLPVRQAIRLRLTESAKNALLVKLPIVRKALTRKDGNGDRY